MFLVKDRFLGMDNYVFTLTDPRAEGYNGDVIEQVSLDYDLNAIYQWPVGHPLPNPQLGRDPRNPKHYKVFKFPEELETARFTFVHDNAPFVAYSWPEYRRRLHPDPAELAKKLTPDEFFDFLETADSVAKIRKTKSEPNEPIRGSTRDQIAEWVARRHMAADGGIYKVYYLPTGAPADEIRLLEVSEWFTGETTTIEPVNFGLDLDGANYKVLVADISGEQLERIKADPTKFLPRGWKFDGVTVWGRRQ